MVPQISHRALISTVIYLAYFQVEVMVVLTSCKTSLQVEYTNPPNNEMIPIPPHFRIAVHTPITPFSSTMPILFKALTTEAKSGPATPNHPPKPPYAKRCQQAQPSRKNLPTPNRSRHATSSQHKTRGQCNFRAIRLTLTEPISSEGVLHSIFQKKKMY